MNPTQQRIICTPFEPPTKYYHYKCFVDVNADYTWLQVPPSVVAGKLTTERGFYVEPRIIEYDLKYIQHQVHQVQQLQWVRRYKFNNAFPRHTLKGN